MLVDIDCIQKAMILHVKEGYGDVVLYVPACILSVDSLDTGIYEYYHMKTLDCRRVFVG